MHSPPSLELTLSYAREEEFLCQSRTRTLVGDASNIDAAEVHTYIQSLINGNEIAEAKILSHIDQNNGRFDFNATKLHDEGVGANSRDLHYYTLSIVLSAKMRSLRKAFTIYERLLWAGVCTLNCISCTS